MIEYTTPTYTIGIRKADLSHFRVLITLSQGRTRRLTKDVTDSKRWDGTVWLVDLPLTQMETARFKEDRPIEIQANLIDINGFRAASKKKAMEDSYDNLLERKVNNG